jgi:hypothetical protein
MKVHGLSNLVPDLAPPPPKPAAPSTTVDQASQPAAEAQISSNASLLSQLQQIQENDPAQFTTAASNLATHFKTAAQDATKQGDPSKATKLGQLSNLFQKAADTGQLPSAEQIYWRDRA